MLNIEEFKTLVIISRWDLAVSAILPFLLWWTLPQHVGFAYQVPHSTSTRTMTFFRDFSVGHTRTVNEYQNIRALPRWHIYSQHTKWSGSPNHARGSSSQDFSVMPIGGMAKGSLNFITNAVWVCYIGPAEVRLHGFISQTPWCLQTSPAVQCTIGRTFKQASGIWPKRSEVIRILYHEWQRDRARILIPRDTRVTFSRSKEFYH